MLTLTDIKWAAEECQRQNSGELSVSNLCNALHFARGLNRILDLSDIRLIGEMVEPEKNARGFRRVPVRFSNFATALPAIHIESALTSLVQNGNILTPTEWYTEFEKIHPFVDGNGRVGSILFNIKNKTLKNPIAPPDVFG